MRRLLLSIVVLAGCTEDRIIHEEASTSGCRCPDPGAVCVAGLCAKRGSCDPYSCDEGYRCNAADEFGVTYGVQPACICDASLATWAQCAPACERDDDCEAGFVCDRPQGTCRYVDRCLSDHVCAADELCRSGGVSEALAETDLNLPYMPTCGSSGAAELGEYCLYDAECASGWCLDFGCVEPRCKSNADCRSSDRCVSGMCAPADGPCGYCDDPAMMCIYSSAACVDPCSTTGDCESGQCLLDYDILYCEGSIPLCAEDEFLVDTGNYNPFTAEAGLACALHQTCWVDADCPPTHGCQAIFDGASGYCTRAAD